MFFKFPFPSIKKPGLSDVMNGSNSGALLRQFLTRKAVNANLLQKMEALLDDYFNSEKYLTKSIPTVQYLADELPLSLRVI